MSVALLEDDMRAVLRRMAARGETVHSVVTDPPYGLASIVRRFGKEGSALAKSDGATGIYRRTSAGFIGKTWDGTGIERDPETWRLCYAVLPPGGFLVSFGGTRTWHRIATAIEDAGFVMSDNIAWLFGTGVPLGNKQQEDGRGTRLKPAFEPIILAQKPLGGTIRRTFAQHGTGTISIDECRVAGGRFPPNVCVGETVALGEASRFFYCPKAGPDERRWGDHPTVKPLALVRWLVRLVTPPGGIVLDPFAGSGTTGHAAALEGRRAVLVEGEREYAEVCRARLREVTSRGLWAVLAEAADATHKLAEVIGERAA